MTSNSESSGLNNLYLGTHILHFIFFCTLSNNLKLYKYLVEELARELEVEFAIKAESRRSGMVIDTMGWTSGLGYQVNFSFLSQKEIMFAMNRMLIC